MFKLFCFDKTLFTALPKDEAMARLWEIFSGDYRSEISALTATEDTLSFSVKDKFGLVYNSFRPDVRMRLVEQDNGTGIQIRCQVKRFRRIFACIFLLLLAAYDVYEAVMLWRLTKGDMNPATLLIPLGMTFFAVLLCNFGLRVSSRWIIAAARNAVDNASSSFLCMGNR